MKKTLKILMFVLFTTTVAFAQSKDFSNMDKLKLTNGNFVFGKVLKVKTTLIEFKDAETGLLFEYEKNKIKYVVLSNGKILTFKNTQEKPKHTITEQKITIENKTNYLPYIVVTIFTTLLILVL